MEEDANLDEHYNNLRLLEKTYFSKSFLPKYSTFLKKYAHKLLDYDDNEFFVKDEVTLGHTKGGRRQLKAVFLQDNERTIEKLIVQEFDMQRNPVINPEKQASFNEREINTLFEFLKNIKEVEFPDDETFNISDVELSKMLLNKQQADKLIGENLEILQEALKNNVSSKDIINYGYRKSQLEIFEKLIDSEIFFDDYKQGIDKNLSKKYGNEAVWQKFFEKNSWILGYGLDYIFNSELDSKRLEQVTSGSNFNENGKRIDALLKSKGAINSLCFCELKLSNTPLLKQVKAAYREESWQISDELSGAIAQVQRTVQKAIKEISTKTEIKDTQDSLTGEVLYLYTPKAFIVIGNLKEFVQNQQINEVKFSSFEMFRKNLRNIEIITYDELYQRAFYICHKKETEAEK